MLDVLLYFIYVAGMVGVIFLFCWLHYKLEIWRLKHRLLNDLIDKGYETQNIDLDKFINNK